MAVGQGFEPREGYKPSAVFKTALQIFNFSFMSVTYGS